MWCVLISRLLLWPETSGHPDYPFKDDLPSDYQLGMAPKELGKPARSSH
jgi:hypothetical protein